VAAEPDDAGVTLVEPLVAMTVMTIFGSVFINAVVQMYSIASHTESAVGAQNQVTIAFRRLDAELRDARGFSAPGPNTGTDRYVEYLVANTATESCGEILLRGSTGQLKWRRWTRGSTPSGWTVLAANLTAATPFTVVTPVSVNRNQTLTLSLTSTWNGRARNLQTMFAALNSNRAVDSSTSCTEGRSAP